jgi:hypothetical protein
LTDIPDPKEPVNLISMKMIFGKNKNFFEIIYRIMEAFWLDHTGIVKDKIYPWTLFGSHKSYEIGLHLLLTFVESTKLAKVTFATLLETKLFPKFIHLLSTSIVNDVSYHTQVKPW